MKTSILTEIRRELRMAQPGEDSLALIGRALMAFGHGSTEVRSVVERLRELDAKVHEEQNP